MLRVRRGNGFMPRTMKQRIHPGVRGGRAVRNGAQSLKHIQLDLSLVNILHTYIHELKRDLRRLGKEVSNTVAEESRLIALIARGGPRTDLSQISTDDDAESSSGTRSTCPRV